MEAARSASILSLSSYPFKFSLLKVCACFWKCCLKAHKGVGYVASLLSREASPPLDLHRKEASCYKPGCIQGLLCARPCPTHLQAVACHPPRRPGGCWPEGGFPPRVLQGTDGFLVLLEQTAPWWLKAARIYYLTAPKVRSLKWVLQAKIKGFEDCVPLWKVEGRIMPCLFHLLEAARIPWLVAPSPILRQQGSVFNLTATPCLPRIRTPASDRARPPASPGSPPHLKIPNLTTSQSQRLGHAHLWGIIPPAAPRKETAVGPLWATHSVNASEMWGHLEDSYWGLWGTSSSFSKPPILSPCGPWLLFWGTLCSAGEGLPVILSVG